MIPTVAASISRSTSGQHSLLAYPLRQPAESSLRVVTKVALSPAVLSSASCRRLQAGSLCSPETDVTLPPDILHKLVWISVRSWLEKVDDGWEAIIPWL